MVMVLHLSRKLTYIRFFALSGLRERNERQGKEHVRMSGIFVVHLAFT